VREVWRARAAGLATPNIGTLTDMICCPGLDFCSARQCRLDPVAKQIHARFDDLDYLYDLGEIEIKMSGCMNACGHHHVGHIGILGVDKHGEEWYQITLGGSAAAGCAGRSDRSVGAAPAVAETIARILDVYVSASARMR
jgi:sulfite reductase (NADPH) hemoprotein beta-component